MFKKIASMALVVGFLLGCIGVDPQGRGYSVAIPMDMINSKLTEQFPVQEERSLGTVEISNPNVLGKQGSDKLGIGTSFKFTNFLLKDGITGSLNLASGVRYDATSKNLYLTNPMVENLKFNDFSLAKYMTDGMKESLGIIISETIAKKPIYNISKLGMGSGFVNAIDIRDGQIYVTFGL